MAVENLSADKERSLQRKGTRANVMGQTDPMKDREAGRWRGGVACGF